MGTVPSAGAVGARFLTLSREPGAGARLVAEEIILEFARREEPDWTIFGAEEFRRAAHAAQLEPSARLADEERYEGALGDFFQQAMGASSEAAVMHAAFLEMRRLAALGRVVFLGRGAACVTRDLGGAHLRLVASHETRVTRLASRYRVGEAEARRIERELTRSRRLYFRRHFEREIDDPHLYDLTMDTDRIGVETAARLAVELVGSPVSAPSPFRPAGF